MVSAAFAVMMILFMVPSAAGAKGIKATKEYSFDGFKLGDNYAEKVKSRSPYDKPCDNDPIDNRSRRFMVYGAEPCRGLSFPEKTTLMFYLKYSQTERYAQPIEAFAFMGGGYFNDKSDLFIKVGDRVDEARSKLGVLLRTFKIKRKGFELGVHQSAGDLYVLFKESQVVGLVIGPMPEDPENEQWRGLMQMYARYTPKQLELPEASGSQPSSQPIREQPKYPDSQPLRGNLKHPGSQPSSQPFRSHKKGGDPQIADFCRHDVDRRFECMDKAGQLPPDVKANMEREKRSFLKKCKRQLPLLFKGKPPRFIEEAHKCLELSCAERGPCLRTLFSPDGPSPEPK